MRIQALATDYDGTLAHDGIVDAPTLQALQRLRSSGRRLLMVTGRELDDLFATFAHCDMFDLIVAENGALLYEPATKTVTSLAPHPPPPLLKALEHHGVPISVGRSIVATVEPYEQQVLAAIRDLGLEWHVIFNKGAVMVLPSGINKATGLVPALAQLGVAAAATAGIGDAENDHAFLDLCGVSVAVANALPSVKSHVQWVTEGARGAGVAELIDRILADDLVQLPEQAHSA
ncbi:HAD family hydrolase [Niveibacterium sp. SC-1]|uniref:HAD family hydrolase n=1 Tax=Niveibacterium sp. SC-1 TaxID=3135646 RepID=UPI00311ECD5F